MWKKDKIDKSMYTRLLDEKDKEKGKEKEKYRQADKIDRSMYARLKEDKDQRVNFTSYSNPMYSGTSSDSNRNDSQSKYTMKTYVPNEKQNKM